MIVTRQRPKPFPWGRLLLPVVAIVLVVVAFVWAPSRNVIVNGPAAPVWRAVGTGGEVASRPFRFDAQNETIAAKNREIRDLNAQVAALHKDVSDRDARIGALVKQTQTLSTQLAEAQGPKAAPVAPVNAAVPGGTTAAATTGAPATAISPDRDLKRTAQVWTQMDPERAAAVAQRLPDAYVAAVFRQMPADQVAEILAAMPPALAARITQQRPVAIP